MAAPHRCRRRLRAPRRRAEVALHDMKMAGAKPRPFCCGNTFYTSRPGVPPGRQVVTIRQRCRSQPQLLLALAERAQPQRVELDEARSVAVIIGHSTFLEGHQVLIV